MAVIQSIILFIGLIFLVKGSDYFVKAAARVAKKLGISEFVIGLTLVAIGTSVPELASSVFASLREKSGLIIGNVVGSNIANIALVIGLAAGMASIKTRKKMLFRDGYIMLFITCVFYIFLLSGIITRFESLILLALYVAYVIFLFETRTKKKDEYQFPAFIRYFFRFRYIAALHRRIRAGTKNARPEKLTAVLKTGIHKDFAILAISSAAIFFGAKYMVIEAIFFAQYFHVPETFIGLTLIAFGTSVPELSVSITAARKGYGNIAVGNIIGSNIANVALVVGVSGVINPLLADGLTLWFTGPAMLLISVFLLIFIKSDWRIRRREGFAFLATYAIFMSALFFATFLLLQ